MLHSTREYQMSRNMNTRRSLYIICLLLLSAVGNKLDAQTVVKSVRQANDSTNHALIHQIGFDVRPGYVAPTNSFLEGDNAQRQSHSENSYVRTDLPQVTNLPHYSCG